MLTLNWKLEKSVFFKIKAALMKKRTLQTCKMILFYAINDALITKHIISIYEISAIYADIYVQCAS